MGSAAALAAGALWGAAFTAEPRPLLAWVALAPLLPLAAGRGPGSRSPVVRAALRAALFGFLHGLAAWLVAIPWIAPTLVTFGGLPEWLGAVLLVVLCSYLGAFHAIFAALVVGPWRRGGAWALLAPPAIWVALEWLRAHFLGGFPWNPAAYAWTDQPGALPTSAWIGAYGVSFLIVLANAGVAAAWCRRWRAAALAILVPLVVLPVGGRWGAGEPEAHGLRPVEVRLVQPNIPNQVEPDWEVIHREYAGLLDLSREACDHGALVVWPESASWPYSYQRDARLRDDLAALAAGGCGVLFNSSHLEGESWFNSAYLLAPDGALARYDKRKLVPFGEYVPLGETFSFIGTLAREAGAFTAADAVSLLPWRGQELGTAICFEIVFPEEVADLVRAGATILVTVTNDAWYGDTAAPWQHFRAARWRAAESRRPVLRAAITGVSGIIAADGSVLGQLGVGRRGLLDGVITPRRDVSPYSRAPWAVPLACTLAGAASLFASGIFVRRRSSSS